jgi:hypothetical protein
VDGVQGTSLSHIALTARPKVFSGLVFHKSGAPETTQADSLRYFAQVRKPAQTSRRSGV